jgi:hypothetical protein
MSTPPQPAWSPPPPRAHQPIQPTHHAEAEHHNAHEHTRLALIIALSIAVVSVLGAVVGWRAEVHASHADRYEQDSVATSIERTAVQAQAESVAAKAASEYEHYLRLEDQANMLSPGACTSQGQRVTLPDFDAGALCQTEVQFSDDSANAYLDAKGNFDIEAYAKDYVAAQAEQDQLNAAEFTDRAEQERHSEDKMLYLSLFLVLALALFTLARLGKSVPTRLMLAVPGWLVLAGSIVFLVSAEV